MKYLLLMLSFSAHAAPLFKAGDCIADKDLERWERVSNTYKVLEVGKIHYNLELQIPKGYIMFSTGAEEALNTKIAHIDRYYVLVECPK